MGILPEAKQWCLSVMHKICPCLINKHCELYYSDFITSIVAYFNQALITDVCQPLIMVSNGTVYYYIFNGRFSIHTSIHILLYTYIYL